MISFEVIKVETKVGCKIGKEAALGKLLLFSMKRMCVQRRGVWLLLVIGMVISCLSMSIIFGFVSKNYYNEVQFGASSSITVWFGESGSSQDDISQLLESPIVDEAKNILFISRDFISRDLTSGDGDTNTRLIGWKGFDVDQWFPHSTGRFFTQEEEEKGGMVAYIHQAQYDASNRFIEYRGEKYYVVGAGFLEAWNVYSPISDESPQTLFSMDNLDVNLITFPYTTYLERNKPELILVHFMNLTHSQLKEKKKQLELMFPTAAVTLPRVNTDTFLDEQLISRGKIAVIFIIIIGITMIQLLMEWLNGNQRQYFILYQCGVPKIKIFALIVMEWTIELILCSLLSSGIHRVLLPVLTILGADTLPILSIWRNVIAIILVASIGIIGICFFKMPLIKPLIWRKKNG